MCTEKQKKYITGLAKKLNIPAEEVNLEALSPEEASKTIKDLLVKLGKSSKGSDKKEVNMPRFGLACKLVLQDKEISYHLTNKAIFKKKVVDLYNLLGESQEEIPGAFPPPSQQEELAGSPGQDSDWRGNWRILKEENMDVQEEPATNLEAHQQLWIPSL